MSLWDEVPPMPAPSPWQVSPYNPQLPSLLGQMPQLPTNLPAPQVRVPQKQGLLDRLGARLMPAPGGLMESGLLSDDDLKAARKQGLLGIGLSLLANSGPTDAAHAVRPFQALGQALQQGQGAYQGAVQSAAGTRQAGQQYSQQQSEAAMKKAAFEKMQSVDQARKTIMAKNPVPTDPSGMAQWLQAVIPQFIDAGDDDTVAHLTPLIDKYRPKTDRYQQTQVGDAATTFDPQTGKFYDPKSGKWVDAVERHMSPDELALRQAQLAETRSRTAANLSMSQDRANQTAYNAFLTHSKDITERAPILKQALVTLRDAKGDPANGIPPNKALYSSAVANFIQAADQKAQIRWQLLNYFKQNVDPSVAGKWEVLKARLLQGTLPGYTMDSMINHLQKLLAMTEEDYARRRSGEIKRHPELEGWLPPSTEYFDEGSFGPSSTSGARPSLDQLWQSGQ